jgi:hypothetical protein
MPLPIACTLPGEAVDRRMATWRCLLERAVTRTERPEPERLRLELRPHQEDIGALALLAQREKACCAFFDFTFEVESDAIALVVRVPPEAQTALDDLASLAARG